MPLNLTADPADLSPRITVIGVGGAGGNAVNNMIEASLEGVEFVCANTDAQAVALNRAGHKLQLGTGVTQGLGAGSRPQIGEAAAEESIDEVMSLIEGSNMLFITAGMGGGTGTGAAPVIAKAARELGILTVGVVTKPFHFEGARRMRIAEEGIEELQRHVDTLLIIPNQNLFRLADENTTFQDAFGMADEVLHAGVRGITDLMIVPGLINLDFADVRAVMSEMGKAMMGTGEASGDDRASAAAAAAISNPLLDETSMQGAKGVLINITGGLDMKLFEVDEAANRIRSEVDPDANIIVGSTFNQELQGTMRVSVVATGIERSAEEGAAPGIPGGRPAVIREIAQPAAETPAPAPAEEPAPQPVAEAPVQAEPEAEVPAPAAFAPQPAENPVGDVHDRIRRMLTEDDATPIRKDLKPAQQRANPFRTGRQGSPLDAAVGALKDAFANRTPAPQTAAPSRPRADKNVFGEGSDDLEIPAFLRRHN
ncbi:cell division protein FtsZ [Parvularcula oceani]|uniref:cell division protein FtsZ n=1 Tax=Parvularcula oceani TaxID=1247963 RepID=UPI0004E12336|nr:cell division protein FtsZ [Parvularcula oceani]